MNASVQNDLASLVRAELDQPVDPRVTSMAAAIAAQHPGAARAVLFYGSCLREQQFEGLMLDFYLIVSDYPETYDKAWLATANRLIPPNVFPFAHDGLVAKYAVLSEWDFGRLCRSDASSVSIWARFAQPSRCVWAVDDAARAAAVASIVEAPVTLFHLTMPMLVGIVTGDPIDIWRRGFELTYGAELRAERGSRPGSVVDSDPERYRRFAEAALAEIARRDGVGPQGEVALFLHPDAAARRWRSLRRRGKALTLLRLAKASLTYAGGIDYLAWKVNRHAGTSIEISDWQRRHPIVAGLLMLPRLLRQSAVR